MRDSPTLLGVVTAALVLIASCSDGGVEPTGSASTTSPASVAGAPPVEASSSSSPAPVETNGPSSSDETIVAATTTTTVAPAVTAASIASEIAVAERGIRDTALPAESVAEFGRRQQRAYQLLARSAGLQEAVTAAIPADVAVAFAYNVAARQAVVDHAAGRPPSEQSPTLPAWTILEPLPIDELLAAYNDAEAATGVPWEYLAAINLVETRMGRIRGDSSAGAQGPMQFLPTTWAACCTGDINDPHDAILGAAVYLVSEGAPSDMQAALYGYNPNDGYVGSVIAYAANLMADPLAYRGYHAWEVYVGSTAGTVRLDVGYTATAPIDAVEYARTHLDATG